MTASRWRSARGGIAVLPPPAAIVPTGDVTVGAIVTITDDTKYNAWPVVCRIDTGALLLAYTKADSHHNDNTGKAVGRLSTDEGASWGAEFTIYDHASLWASVFGVMTMTTGRIIATLWRDDFGTSATGEAGIVYSDDDGSTWSAWIALTNGFTKEDFGAGPAIELANGDLLVTIEGSNTGQPVANRSSHTVKSTDDGATWGSEVTVRNYVTDTRPYYESKLVRLASDDLLCVHRTSGGPGTHYISLSTDDGATWGAPSAEVAGYGAPSTIQLPNGVLIFGTRRNADAAVIVYTSLDEGSTWGSEVEVDDTMYEMEYACPVRLLDGRVLLVYGSQPSSLITNSDIKAAFLTVS